MKLRSILAIGALSLGAASMANAATSFVYITGSTAFRAAVFDALATNTFDASPAVSIVATKCNSASTPADPGTAGQMMFTGNISGQPYVIKCAWSGSEAGVTDVTAPAGTTEAFIATGTAAQTNTSTLATPDSHTVDLAFADTDQSVSLTPTPVLNGTQVGVIPFVIVKNAQTNGTTFTGSPSSEWLGFKNVTDAEMRVLLSGGSPGALITGNPADTNWVYIAGRDNQSGTFVNTMLDTGFGLANDPSQIEIVAGSGGQANISGGVLLSGKGKGVEGQNSGGTLANSMAICGSGSNPDPVASSLFGENNSGWYAFAYLGLPDYSTVSGGTEFVVNPPAGVVTALTYEGVAETPANVENGTYPFWGNEFLFESANNLSTAGAHLFSLLQTSIPVSCDNVSYFKTDSMLAVKINSAADATHQ